MVLKLMERVRGPDHPETLRTRFNLASVQGNNGNRADAEAEYRALLKLYERVRGPDHPDTLITLYHLALCLKEQDKMQEAREFARRAVEGARKTLAPTDDLTKEFEKVYEEIAPKK